MPTTTASTDHLPDASTQDFPLPSSSTAIKEDHPEKLRKKLKVFLDEKQKVKSRLQSLWSYLDAIDSFDQCRFTQEYYEQVFHVVHEACIQQIDKMKQRHERPQTWHAKEMVSLQKMLLLLRKIFLFVPEMMRNGWQRQNIATLLAHILDHGNHIRLRALGFHLLLLWLNDQVVEYPECMQLFANALSLDLFIMDDISASSEDPLQQETDNNPSTDDSSNLLTNALPFVKKLSDRHAEKLSGYGLVRNDRVKQANIHLQQSFIHGDDHDPLFPSPVPPTFHDSLVLFNIFITNLVRLASVAAGSPPPPDNYDYPEQCEPDEGIATGTGIDAATASAKFLFKIFRTYYMTKFVPHIASELQMEGATKTDSNQPVGFPRCPPSILRTVLRFLIGYCLDNNHSAQVYWPNLPAQATSSPATPILKSIVLSSHETREMLHDMIRQCMLLPTSNANYWDITRGALHIIGVWSLGNEDERPSFLRPPGATPGMIRSTSSTSLTKYHEKKPKPTPPLLPVASSHSLEDLPLSPPPQQKRHTPQPHQQSEANVFLRRYFTMIQLIFDQPSATVLDPEFDWDGLVNLYKDAINVYRSITVTRGGIEMEWESWECLLRCVMCIQKWIMAAPTQTSRIAMPALADDFVDYLCETVFYAFARARIAHSELWHELQQLLLAGLDRWQVLDQWTKIMYKITKVLSHKLYKVDYDVIYRTPSQFYLDKSGSVPNRLSGSFYDANAANATGVRRSRTRHLSIQDEQNNPSRAASSKIFGNRPISIGTSNVASVSEGELLDLPACQPHQHILDLASGFPLPPGVVEVPLPPAPSTMPNMLPLEEDKPTAPSNSISTGRKFGIKNIIPATSFSSSHTSSLLVPQNGPSASSVSTSGHLTHSSPTHHHPPLTRHGNDSVEKVQHTPLSPTRATSVSSAPGSRRGRRTVSIHQFDHLFQESGSKLLNFVHASASQSGASTPSHPSTTDAGASDLLGTHHDTPQPSTSKLNLGSNSSVAYKDDEGANTQKRKGLIIDWDRRSNGSTNLTLSSKSNRTSASTILAPTEMITMKITPADVNDKLPADLGIFRSSEFLNLHNLPWDGPGTQIIWMNLLCSLGNINKIESPQRHDLAMRCVVDIWDTLIWVRDNQPYRGLPTPALYDITSWLLQGTELPSGFNAGRSKAYGCLCRLVCRKTRAPQSKEFYAHFYRTILKGLTSDDSQIIQAIIQNCERLFTFSLPGAHILIPPFIHTIEKQLVVGGKAAKVPLSVRKSCITILGSLTSVSNQFSDVQLGVKTGDGQCTDTKQLKFSDVKIWLKNLFIQLVDVDPATTLCEEETEVHCMLLGATCSLIMDELLATKTPQRSLIQECITVLVSHLYWCNISVINAVVDCLVLISQIYNRTLDPEGDIIQEVLTRIIDALNVQLKFYKSNVRSGRGIIIAKLFTCILEWLMIIEPEILTDTELCQLVFDVIDEAMHFSAGGRAEKMLPHPPLIRKSSRAKKKEVPFKFLLTEKRPQVMQDPTPTDSSEVNQADQSCVNDAAEAVLLHLLHHFNNFPPPYGPATACSTIVGPGLSSSTDDKNDIEYRHFQYFSFNDTTIIAFVELPPTDTKPAETRIVIRDLTGRYAWDAHLEPPFCDSPLTFSPLDDGAKFEAAEDHLLEREQGFTLRPGLLVKKRDQSSHSSLTSSPDTLSSLLQDIGEDHPDCMSSSNVSMTSPSTLSSLQVGMLGRLSEQLNDFLTSECDNHQQRESDPRVWYAKLNAVQRRSSQTPAPTSSLLSTNFSAQKDFCPALPRDPEKTNVPFQQSRLLISHLGLLSYSQLKDGSFQMLNKTSALFRDLRGLDRKPGHETMKIGLMYVGADQEDEQSILHNNSGSAAYDAFVKSLGWEIDIAKHTGYLGGLERNLTNGNKATYFCSSTVEIIFHDVTKMPTDVNDPKQLKKKRHIGNDHVHIVWNEHNRDYHVGTIGGDFGNAQIVVTPLPDGLYSIHLHRDPKIPMFGPLFNQMTVSHATLGPMVRATAIAACRACVHTNTPSIISQRARDVKTITQRHKVATWSYEQFVERIFLPED
ncbi:hypothetical protein DM01DRAFT_1335187 [Hesseltinella vesiculosa]|uniref:Rap-GAP domain-containing protein n=1 Tax=Hesseltinella vesiculosa TaxID=101127 RepID=A0A1X2GLP9_9FUNG|nr:hypothetical protein DM01DRAFT_1335187 [Hesseltinella vesiculosa]